MLTKFIAATFPPYLHHSQIRCSVYRICFFLLMDFSSFHHHCVLCQVKGPLNLQGGQRDITHTYCTVLSISRTVRRARKRHVYL